MSDDNKAFAARHASKIQAEHAVMDMTGLTRSQIRGGLRNFQRQISAQQGQRKVEANVAQPTGLIKITKDSFYPSKIEPKPTVVSSSLTFPLPADPAVDGDYVLRLTIASGARTELVWEKIEAC